MRRVLISMIALILAGKPLAAQTTSAEDEAIRKRRISNVEVKGTAAIGRIELDYPNAFFVDYMTLLKDRGRWVIIAKSFDRTLKSP